MSEPGKMAHDAWEAAWKETHPGLDLAARERAAWAAVEAAIRADQREKIAQWLDTQRTDVPAHGWEFASAIRGGKE